MSIGNTRVTWDEYLKHRGHWLLVSELAKKLNVHPGTIRRWADSGRIKSIRHPVSEYRLFLDTDFEGAKGREH